MSNEPDDSVESRSVKRKTLPDVEFLRECFSYNPDTGDLLWRSRPRHHFGKDWLVGWWANRYGGKNAGNIHTRTNKTISGMMTRIDGHWYRTHRVIYKMMLEVEPPEDVDHEDGNPLNNKWTNLRGGTHQQNMCNQNPDRRGKKSGLPKGISKNSGGYQAILRIHGKFINLGYSKDLSEAIEMRKAGEAKYFKDFAWKSGEKVSPHSQIQPINNTKGS